jgi:Na+/proline symporter
VTVIYCLKGGMKAVVWTDVLQFALMYGTIAIALVTIAHDVPGGFGGLVSVAHTAGKFKAFLFDWDFVGRICRLAVVFQFHRWQSS